MAPLIEVNRLNTLLAVTIYIVGLSYAIFSIKDIHRFVMLTSKRQQDTSDKDHVDGSAAAGALRLAGRPERSAAPPDTSTSGSSQQQWSTFAIVCLTSYRFYTGFLSATWLPYLLAMEGKDLWLSKQSLFMGIAKLIYGLTILLNPLLGLIGDQATVLSYGIGRRLFVRIGVTTAAVGIYICVLSARTQSFLGFLSGLLVWRLGEAINDVTTEALVPDLVPQSQYQMASAIKACSFLLGGLFGYMLLLALVDVHYSWLYLAYPIGMFTCSVPSLLLLSEDLAPTQSGARRQERGPFMTSLYQAYVVPLTYKGGFPTACLAAFIFSLGTAPMFFLLLIVRDLVGVTNAIEMQKQFSASSMLFFMSAAAASVLGAVPEGSSSAQTAKQERAGISASAIDRRSRTLVASMVIFGLVVLVIPGLAWFQNSQEVNIVFYSLTLVFGAAFGLAFSAFQDVTWQILPRDVEVANAMGFNVMSRLLGVGLGNFLCGFMLELSDTGSHRKYGQVYQPYGYMIMCCFSSCCVFISCVVAWTAMGQAKANAESAMVPKVQEEASSSSMLAGPARQTV